eukprot:11636596-Alexandrium_andersonii.AAC.1
MISSVLKSPARAIVDSAASTSMCGLETAQYWQETMAQAFGEDLCEIQDLPPVEFTYGSNEKATTLTR